MLTSPAIDLDLEEFNDACKVTDDAIVRLHRAHDAVLKEFHQKRAGVAEHIPDWHLLNEQMRNVNLRMSVMP